MSVISIAENSIPVGLQMIANSISEAADIKLVNRWIKEYQEHAMRDVRRRRILKAIGEGYDTLSEIISETQIPQTSAVRVLERLVKTKVLAATKEKNYNCRIETRYELIKK